MSGTEVELSAIVADASSDSGVAHGAVLTAFVDAVLTGADDAARAREAVRHALGDAALVDAAATVASFNAVVKLADGTGIPLEDWKAARTADLRAELDIEAYRSGSG